MKGLMETLKYQKEREEVTERGIHVTVSESDFNAIARLKSDGEIKTTMSYVRDLIEKDLKERKERKQHERFS